MFFFSKKINETKYHKPLKMNKNSRKVFLTQTRQERRKNKSTLTQGREQKWYFPCIFENKAFSGNKPKNERDGEERLSADLRDSLKGNQS